ncbi:hypothetical protein P43SY_006105 [Pythium insidiosum]|uniref:Myb-like DNA-binding protein n=1 Tax=Pythium insidiosum TaxID=114742 RepID=A0AAD5LBP7_PYTIN|nr:hypothetical protein P43SY_006105 [Pythium insidiosum]KAJ0396859.1 hypothetical protein ATCC90586_008222 [Pythium insidiosum]
MATRTTSASKVNHSGLWSVEEHDRFLDAMKRYPRGPWKRIADFVGTRSIRQVQSHAQKYQEKVLRRVRGVTKRPKNMLLRQEHRVDLAALTHVLDRSEWTDKSNECREVQALSRPSDDSSSSCSETEGITSTDSPIRRLPRHHHEIESFSSDDESLPSVEASLDFLLDVLLRS